MLNEICAEWEVCIFEMNINIVSTFGMYNMAADKHFPCNSKLNNSLQ